MVYILGPACRLRIPGLVFVLLYRSSFISPGLIHPARRMPLVMTSVNKMGRINCKIAIFNKIHTIGSLPAMAAMVPNWPTSPLVLAFILSSKLERYYVFNDHNEEDLAVGVREGVEEDVNKRNKNDFVLWFTKSKFEDQALKWDSPWGVGYPGWHIECSGISMKYNGEYLDLHCGGVDNAFPHHTNEIAQSESYLGHPWCPQWCHVAHLNTSSGKMSKSKGEFLTVSLLEEKGYAPVVYRFFCLQSHYRKSLVFSWENLDNAAVAYGKLIARIVALPGEDGAVDMAAAAALQQKFRTAMDNDLNTSMAVTVLYDVLKAKTNGATKRYVLADFDRVLSLDLLENAARKKAEQKQTAPASGGFQIVSESGETDAQVEALLQARYDAKKAKDFTEADRIRDDLKAMGVEITDIPGGVRWKR